MPKPHLELLAAGFAAALAVTLPATHLMTAPARAQGQAQEQGQPGASAEALTQAAAPSAAARLADLMRMDQTFAIMVEEGKAHGADLEKGFFPGRGGAAWAQTVARIYDPALMQSRFVAAFEAALKSDPAAVAEAEAFFGSALGQKVLGLEIDARRAMIDDDISEAAEVAAEKMKAARDPRLRLIRRMIEAGDLVEMNVAGALGANLAFSRGLSDAMPPGQRQDPDDMMAEVWGQEAGIRASTTTWLYSYLTMAYAPLSDAELKSYIDFWASPAGKAVNAALFAGSDAVFAPLSQDLGAAVAGTAQSTDI